MQEALNTRKANYEISDLIIGRWSPRAYAPIDLSDDELMPLFEAARWAPSSRNNQPWRFIYAKRGTYFWDKFFGFLNEFNQSWAKNASVLVLLISKKTFDDGSPSVSHSLDAGAAWENMAIEATRRGLITHPIGAFDTKKARDDLEIPEEFEIEIMIAIGKRGNTNELTESLRAREKPNDRKPLNEILFEGSFS